MKKATVHQWEETEQLHHSATKFAQSRIRVEKTAYCTECFNKLCLTFSWTCSLVKVGGQWK